MTAITTEELQDMAEFYAEEVRVLNGEPRQHARQALHNVQSVLRARGAL
jgi:hypothetical protein